MLRLFKDREQLTLKQPTNFLFLLNSKNSKCDVDTDCSVLTVALYCLWFQVFCPLTPISAGWPWGVTPECVFACY